MVILSVAVMNKKGKILVARQYVPMSRLRIEGLLAAFPKLVDSEENSSSKQHTFIETDEVRYIYQPMDTLYLLLVTNMQSNIIEDLNTLRMVAKLIPEYCQGHDEEAIQKNAFELVFAVDEVITPMGYREQVTTKQIQQFTEMESAEEKLTQIIEESKVHNQQEFLRKKEKEFDKQRIKETGRPSFPGSQYLEKFQHLGFDSKSSASMRKTGDPQVSITTHGIGSDSLMNKSSGISDSDDSEDHGYKPKKKSKTRGGPRKGGMKLGGTKSKGDKIMKDVLQLDKSSLNRDMFDLLKTSSGLGDNNNGDDDGPLTDVEVFVVEKLYAKVDRDGVLSSFEIKGDMEIVINNPDCAQAVFHSNIDPRKKSSLGDKITWRLHPKMNSKLWRNGQLALKDSNKSFRVGRSCKTSILKWRLASKNEDAVPIKFEFWAEPELNKINVTATYIIEQEDVELKNCIISLPSPTQEDVDVDSVDGNYNFDKRNGEIQWILGDIETESQGEFSYKLEDVEVEDLYPITIHFDMEKSYTGVTVDKVVSVEDGEEEYEYEVKTVCHADKFVFGQDN